MRDDVRTLRNALIGHDAADVLVLPRGAHLFPAALCVAPSSSRLLLAPSPSYRTARTMAAQVAAVAQRCEAFKDAFLAAAEAEADKETATATATATEAPALDLADCDLVAVPAAVFFLVPETHVRRAVLARNQLRTLPRQLSDWGYSLVGTPSLLIDLAALSRPCSRSRCARCVFKQSWTCRRTRSRRCRSTYSSPRSRR